MKDLGDKKKRASHIKLRRRVRDNKLIGGTQVLIDDVKDKEASLARDLLEAAKDLFEHCKSDTEIVDLFIKLHDVEEEIR